MKYQIIISVFFVITCYGTVPMDRFVDVSNLEQLIIFAKDQDKDPITYETLRLTIYTTITDIEKEQAVSVLCDQEDQVVQIDLKNIAFIVSSVDVRDSFNLSSDRGMYMGFINSVYGTFQFYKREGLEQIVGYRSDFE